MPTSTPEPQPMPCVASVRVLRMRGQIIDDGRGGSDWSPSEVDDQGHAVPYDDTSTDVEDTEEAARLIIDAGCVEIDSAPSFYNPDGSYVADQATGEREETSAHIKGLSPAQLDDVCRRIAA